MAEDVIERFVSKYETLSGRVHMADSTESVAEAVLAVVHDAGGTRLAAAELPDALMKTLEGRCADAGVDLLKAAIRRQRASRRHRRRPRGGILGGVRGGGGRCACRIRDKRRDTPGIHVAQDTSGNRSRRGDPGVLDGRRTADPGVYGRAAGERHGNVHIRSEPHRGYRDAAYAGSAWTGDGPCGHPGPVEYHLRDGFRKEA